MTRSPEQAISWTQTRGAIPGGAGWCKRETRTAYDVPSDGSEDATQAFHRTKFRHSSATVPPRGAVCWWTGGRNGHGHVAISLGEHRIRSTDLPVSGHWGTAHLDDPSQLWGLRYEGWSEDIDGVRVFRPAPVKPKPKPKPTRLAKLRAQLLRVANDPKVGPRRRQAARRAAAAIPSWVK